MTSHEMHLAATASLSKFVIHKHALEVGCNTIRVTPDFRLIHVGNQRDQICVWVIEQTGSEKTREIQFMVVGTGVDVTGLLVLPYLGTVQAGPFVWHVFYEP